MLARRGRRGVIGVAAFVAAVVAAIALLGWWVRGRGVRGTPARALGRLSAPTDLESPVLVGNPPPGRTARAPEALTSSATDDLRGGGSARARTQDVFIVDRSGRAVPYASVTVTIETGTHTTEEPASTETGSQTGPDGRTVLALPPGRPTAVRVETRGTGGLGRVTVFSRSSASALDLSELAHLVLDAHELLIVRTVGEHGQPRPNERIEYRPLTQETAGAVWGGDTSDGDALCYLGPYPTGVEVELRPGAFGRTGKEAEATPWSRATVGGRTVDLNVGDNHPLRVRVLGLRPGQKDPIVVTSSATQQVVARSDGVDPSGVWTSNPLAAGHPVDVLVGPLDDGRYARRTGVVPGHGVVEIDLVAGTPLTGGVDLPDGSGTVSGTVRLTGRDFQIEVPLDEYGRFGFPGVPDEDVTLDVHGAYGQDGGRFLGHAILHDHDRVGIEVVRSVRVSGRLRPADAEGHLFFAQIQGTRTEDQATATAAFDPSNATFTLDVIPGHWTLSVFGLDSDGKPEFGRSSFEIEDVGHDRTGVVIDMRRE